MSVATPERLEPVVLDFTVETIERFGGAWGARTRRRSLLPRAEETLDCETIDCAESDECETVAVCSALDCSGCGNSCSCVA